MIDRCGLAAQRRAVVPRVTITRCQRDNPIERRFCRIETTEREQRRGVVVQKTRIVWLARQGTRLATFGLVMHAEQGVALCDVLQKAGGPRIAIDIQRAQYLKSLRTLALFDQQVDQQHARRWLGRIHRSRLARNLQRFAAARLHAQCMAEKNLCLYVIGLVGEQGARHLLRGRGLTPAEKGLDVIENPSGSVLRHVQSRPPMQLPGSIRTGS